MKLFKVDQAWSYHFVCINNLKVNIVWTLFKMVGSFCCGVKSPGLFVGLQNPLNIFGLRQLKRHRGFRITDNISCDIYHFDVNNLKSASFSTKLNNAWKLQENRWVETDLYNDWYLGNTLFIHGSHDLS